VKVSEIERKKDRKSEGEGEGERGIGNTTQQIKRGLKYINW
jgi:hypothetical protein